jgi:hypothetical protein
MTSFNPVKRLQDAGMALDTLPQDQRDVITSLSAEEVETLIRIQERIKGEEYAEVHPETPSALMF